MKRSAFAAIIALLISLLGATHAAPQGKLEGALTRFAADSFAETVAAIEEIAASGAPQAAPLLEALAAGRLLFDPAQKTVYYKDMSDQLLDALSGAAATAPPELSPVRLNNRVRS